MLYYCAFPLKTVSMSKPEKLKATPGSSNNPKNPPATTFAEVKPPKLKNPLKLHPTEDPLPNSSTPPGDPNLSNNAPHPPSKPQPKVHTSGRKKLKATPTIVDFTLLQGTPPVSKPQELQPQPSPTKIEPSIENVEEQPVKPPSNTIKTPAKPKTKTNAKQLKKLLKNDSKPLLFNFMRQKDVPETDTPDPEQTDQTGPPPLNKTTVQFQQGEILQTLEDLWPPNNDEINPNPTIKGDPSEIKSLKKYPPVKPIIKEGLQPQKGARDRFLLKKYLSKEIKYIDPDNSLSHLSWLIFPPETTSSPEIPPDSESKPKEVYAETSTLPPPSQSLPSPQIDTLSITSEDLEELRTIQGEYEVPLPERFFWVNSNDSDDKNQNPFHSLYRESKKSSNLTRDIYKFDSQTDLQYALYENNYLHPMQAPIVPKPVHTGFEIDYTKIEFKFPEIHSFGDVSDKQKWGWVKETQKSQEASLPPNTDEEFYLYPGNKSTGELLESSRSDFGDSNLKSITNDADLQLPFSIKSEWVEGALIQSMEEAEKAYEEIKEEIPEESVKKRHNHRVGSCFSSLYKCLAYSFGRHRAAPALAAEADPWYETGSSEPPEKFLGYNPEDFETLGNPEVFLGSLNHLEKELFYGNVLASVEKKKDIPWFYRRKPPGPDYPFTLEETETLLSLSKKLIVSGDYENEIPLFLEETIAKRNPRYKQGRFYKIFAYRGITLFYCIEIRRAFRDFLSFNFHPMRCRASMDFEIIHPTTQKILLKVKPSFLGEVCALTRYINDFCLGCCRLTKWTVTNEEGMTIGRILCLPRMYNWTNCAGGPYLILENSEGIRFSWYEQIFPIFDYVCTHIGSRRLPPNPEEIVFEDGLQTFKYGRIRLCKPIALAQRPAMFTIEYNYETCDNDRLLILGGSFVLASMAWFTPNPSFADRFFFKIGNIF